MITATDCQGVVLHIRTLSAPFFYLNKDERTVFSSVHDGSGQVEKRALFKICNCILRPICLLYVSQMEIDDLIDELGGFIPFVCVAHHLHHHL